MNRRVKRTALAAEITACFALAACGSAGGDENSLALTPPVRTAAVVTTITAPDQSQLLAAALPDAGVPAPAQRRDTLAPSAPASLLVTAASDSSVSLSWQASNDNEGVTGYIIWRDDQRLHTVNEKTLAFTDSSLASATSYAYHVTAIDMAGNSSAPSIEQRVATAVLAPRSLAEAPASAGGAHVAAASGVQEGRSARVLAAADTLAPLAPSALTVADHSMSTLKLTWRDSVDNVGVTGYDIFRNGVWIGTTSGHSHTFRNLAARTSYQLGIKVYDAAGNRSALTTVTAATLGAAAPADTIAPGIPTELTTGAITASSVTLKWNPSSDAVGVAGYELYKDGIVAGGTSGATSFTFDRLVAGTSYRFSVKAFDTAGNKSPSSTALTARTGSVGALTAEWNANGVIISGRNPWTENPMMFWDDVNAAFAASGLQLGAEVPAGPDQLYGASSTVAASRFKYQRTSATRSGEMEIVYAGTGHKPILSYPKYNGPARNFDKMYVSWWYKPSMSPGAEGASNKFVRFWDNGNGNGTRISWTQMHMTCAVPAGYKPEVSWGNWWEEGGVAGKWNRLEIELDLSVPRVRTWVNGSAGHQHPCVKSSDFSSTPVRLALIGFDHGGYADGTHGYDSMKTSLDDIYIANSPARVELSTGTTWSTASKREVLPVKSWTPSRIELGKVRGVLKGARQLYAYVVAADGSVNANGIALSCSADCP